jgi:hypothetical protein
MTPQMFQELSIHDRTCLLDSLDQLLDRENGKKDEGHGGDTHEERRLETEKASLQEIGLSDDED